MSFGASDRPYVPLAMGYRPSLKPVKPVTRLTEGRNTSLLKSLDAPTRDAIKELAECLGEDWEAMARDLGYDLGFTYNMAKALGIKSVEDIVCRDNTTVLATTTDNNVPTDTRLWLWMLVKSTPLEEPLRLQTVEEYRRVLQLDEVVTVDKYSKGVELLPGEVGRWMGYTLVFANEVQK